MASEEISNEEPELTPAQLQAFVAELERVLGSELTTPGIKFERILPVTGPDEFLAALSSAPSGIGVAGVEAHLRERLGTVAGLKAIAPESGAPDV